MLYIENRRESLFMPISFLSRFLSLALIFGMLLQPEMASAQSNAPVVPPEASTMPKNPALEAITPATDDAQNLLEKPRRATNAYRQTPEADDIRPPVPSKPDQVLTGKPVELPTIASENQSDSTHEASQRFPWVGIVYELEKSDTSNAFISNALNGAYQAHEELRVPFFEKRITTPADREKILEAAAKKYKLVIGIGSQLVPTIISLAEKYPETRFTLIDGMVPPLFNNVQSVVFKDHEGAFLVGMLAAYASRTRNVGFIGGMDIPVIRNFAIGFQQGIHFVDPNIQIQNGMVGSPTATADAWNSPDQAEKIARDMYRKGADIIFAAAGTSGVGVMRAAKQLNQLAIGVDSNQNYLFPGTVLTSMVKRVDRAVYDTIRSAKEGEWQPGIKYMGIKEEALDYSVDRNNRHLISQQMLDSLENAKDMIIRGSKSVETYQP
jgi:basic membrane protein A